MNLRTVFAILLLLVMIAIYILVDTSNPAPFALAVMLNRLDEDDETPEAHKRDEGTEAWIKAIFLVLSAVLVIILIGRF